MLQSSRCKRQRLVMPSLQAYRACKQKRAIDHWRFPDAAKVEAVQHSVGTAANFKLPQGDLKK